MNKFTSIKNIVLSLCCVLILASCSKNTSEVTVYTTTADETKKMAIDSIELVGSKDIIQIDNVINIDPSVQYQKMDGFGAAITGVTCYNLLKMSPEDRSKLLKETFDPVTGYGYSYIRISIACSDFSLEEYTYCDTPGIENFAIHELDKRDLFPILKEIQSINPDVKIMASPWTPPKWMKVNNLQDLKPFDSWTSGQLNPKYYNDYATYFVKYLQAMKSEGFDIDAITIQNEPLNRGNSASLYMTWQEQRDFVKSALGPAFKDAGIGTKIIIYDHNYNYDSEKAENGDQGGYPSKVYADSDAAQYIDGAAYHAYGGDKIEMRRVHEANPDKNLYFTEISIGMWGNGYTFADDLMWNMREVGIGAMNNYCKAVMVWNFMLDDKHGPFRPLGCHECLGAVDVNSSDYSTLKYNSHYYTMAHLSKVIKPDAVRIKSEGNLPAGIYYSAFHNPDNSYSLIMQNDTENPEEIVVRLGDDAFKYKMDAKSVSSYIWNTQQVKK